MTRSSVRVDEPEIERTKHLLMDAAERLMAEHGIEGAELNEIQRLAGQRNRSAIAYHFGDRTGLLMAMGARRRATANEDRNRLLDRLERQGAITVEALVGALVRPMAAELTTRGGRDYLIVLAEAATRMGSIGLVSPVRSDVDSVERVRNHLVTLLQGARTARDRAIGRSILITPVLLADIARDRSAGRLTDSQLKRQVDEVVTLVASALGR